MMTFLEVYYFIFFIKEDFFLNKKKVDGIVMLLKVLSREA